MSRKIDQIIKKKFSKGNVMFGMVLARGGVIV
jgi:hypothetical protein